MENTLEIEKVLSPASEEVNAIIDKTYRSVPYIVSSVIIILLFTAIAFGVRSIACRILKRRGFNYLVIQAASNLLAAFVFLIGLYFALRSSGLSGLAFTVLGGTGVIGIGLGLALKSTFENYASGLMISLRQLFRRGEIVRIDNFEGIVQSVTTRGTTIMDYEGNNVIIPNSKVFNSVIKNLTRNPNMRVDFTVGIGYKDSIDRARSVIMNTLRQTSSVLKDPEPLVTVDSLGAATVNLKVYLWFNAVQHGLLKVRSVAIQRVKEALMQADISLPDDAREVVFTSPLRIIQGDETKQAKQEKPQVTEAPTPASELEHRLENDVEQVRQQAATSEPAEKGDDLLD